MTSVHQADERFPGWHNSVFQIATQGQLAQSESKETGLDFIPTN